jgi:molybdopterin/thiamine biosynthesis adenylyltransferase
MERMNTTPEDSLLSPEDRIRFARPLLLPEIGAEGHARLSCASVLVVGAGGLGSSVLVHLAASGVGRIGIVDPDSVELGNLHRQIVHGMDSLGTAKVESARRRMNGINPRTEIETHPVAFSESNADDLTSSHDLVIDASDNLAARRAINRACIRQKIPMVFGCAQRFDGQISIFDAARGPCFRCVFPDLPDSGVIESPSKAGVFGPVPGVIGTLQALEAMKILLGIGKPLLGKILVFDGLAGNFIEIQAPKNPRCPECRPSG